MRIKSDEVITHALGEGPQEKQVGNYGADSVAALRSVLASVAAKEGSDHHKVQSLRDHHVRRFDDSDHVVAHGNAEVVHRLIGDG